MPHPFVPGLPGPPQPDANSIDRVNDVDAVLHHLRVRASKRKASEIGADALGSSHISGDDPRVSCLEPTPSAKRTRAKTPPWLSRTKPQSQDTQPAEPPSSTIPGQPSESPSATLPHTYSSTRSHPPPQAEAMTTQSQTRLNGTPQHLPVSFHHETCPVQAPGLAAAPSHENRDLRTAGGSRQPSECSPTAPTVPLLYPYGPESDTHHNTPQLTDELLQTVPQTHLSAHAQAVLPPGTGSRSLSRDRQTTQDQHEAAPVQEQGPTPAHSHPVIGQLQDTGSERQGAENTGLVAHQPSQHRTHRQVSGPQEQEQAVPGSSCVRRDNMDSLMSQSFQNPWGTVIAHSEIQHPDTSTPAGGMGAGPPKAGQATGPRPVVRRKRGARRVSKDQSAVHPPQNQPMYLHNSHVHGLEQQTGDQWIPPVSHNPATFIPSSLPYQTSHESSTPGSASTVTSYQTPTSTSTAYTSPAPEPVQQIPAVNTTMQDSLPGGSYDASSAQAVVGHRTQSQLQPQSYPHMHSWPGQAVTEHHTHTGPSRRAQPAPQRRITSAPQHASRSVDGAESAPQHRPASSSQAPGPPPESSAGPSTHIPQSDPNARSHPYVFIPYSTEHYPQQQSPPQGVTTFVHHGLPTTAAWNTSTPSDQGPPASMYQGSMHQDRRALGEIERPVQSSMQVQRASEQRAGHVSQATASPERPPTSQSYHQAGPAPAPAPAPHSPLITSAPGSAFTSLESLPEPDPSMGLSQPGHAPPGESDAYTAPRPPSPSDSSSSVQMIFLRRLREYEARMSASEREAQAAIVQARERAFAWEKQAKEWRKRAKEGRTALRTMESRAREAELRVREMEGRVVEAEGRLREVEGRAGDVDGMREMVIRAGEREAQVVREAQAAKEMLGRVGEREAHAVREAQAARELLVRAEERAAEWERRSRVMEGEREEAMRRLGEMEMARSSMEDELGTAKKKLQEREKEGRVDEGRHRSLCNELASLGARNMELEAEVQRLTKQHQTELEGTWSKLVALEQTRGQLSLDLSCSKLELQARNVQVLFEQDKTKAQADQITTLETEVARLQAEAEGRAREHAHQMEDVRAELVKVNAQRQDEERLAKEREAKLQEQVTNLEAEAEHQRADSDRQVQQHRAEMEVMQTGLALINAQRKDEELELATLRDEARALAAEVEGLKAASNQRAQEHEKEMEAMLARFVQAEAQVDQEGELEKLRVEACSLNAEVDRLRAETDRRAQEYASVMEGVTKVQVTEEPVTQKQRDSPQGEVAHEPIEDSTMLNETATTLLPNTTVPSQDVVVPISNTPVLLEDLPEDPSTDFQQGTKAHDDRTATGLAIFMDTLRSQPDLGAHTDFELPPYLRQYAVKRPTQQCVLALASPGDQHPDGVGVVPPAPRLPHEAAGTSGTIVSQAAVSSVQRRGRIYIGTPRPEWGIAVVSTGGLEEKPQQDGKRAFVGS